MDQALLRIGLDPIAIHLVRTAPYRTRDDIIKAIQTRLSTGLSLESCRVLEGKNSDACLYKWACKLFGRWSRAIAAAGLKFSP